MSTILIGHKVESSKGERSSKYERKHKLMLICSDVPKLLQKLQNVHTVYRPKWFSNTYYKYTFKRRQRQHYGFQFLILAKNSNKDLVDFITTVKISQILEPK